ncbi:hypothetical protein BT96DRAFT_999474 [Gymnopus androsaceus JB14]|uniref:Uncharacterized protein n=1 Tax=Gymnopus androsaceus JB14 TaxID=1447944 RepID=A0A6A4H6L1_9AGAR|nr:hypothetical protein BT96DRAFT_999474 [Gymnopus androsaceus JB14]
MAQSGLPDYLLDPNAVLKDQVKWRYDKVPDYTRLRADYELDKKVEHKPGTLSFYVNNLVKNWEIEASYKIDGREWRTIDPDLYKFKSNDGPWLSVDEMLKLGTYNAVIGESEYYSSENSNFTVSHKTFKRAIRSFGWEVLEVYSELPTVVFTWRHFGVFHGAYKAYNRDGNQIESQPTNELLDITGMGIAHMTPDLRIASIHVYRPVVLSIYDPAELFRQMTKNGISIVGKLPDSMRPQKSTSTTMGGKCPMLGKL